MTQQHWPSPPTPQFQPTDRALRANHYGDRFANGRPRVDLVAWGFYGSIGAIVVFVVVVVVVAVVFIVAEKSNRTTTATINLD